MIKIDGIAIFMILVRTPCGISRQHFDKISKHRLLLAANDDFYMHLNYDTKFYSYYNIFCHYFSEIFQ